MSKSQAQQRPSGLTTAFRHLLHDYMVERDAGRTPYTTKASDTYREAHSKFQTYALEEGKGVASAVVASVCRTVYDEIKDKKGDGIECIQRWDFGILYSLSVFYGSMRMSGEDNFLSEKPLPPTNDNQKETK
jgi:hypothetical protein